MSEMTHPVADAIRARQVASFAVATASYALNTARALATELAPITDTLGQDNWLAGFDAATEHHAAELTRVRERADLAERAQSQFNMEAESEIRSHDRTKQQLDALKRSNDTLRERVQELEQATALQPLDAIPAGWVNVYQNGGATLFKSEEIARSVVSTPETEFAVPLYRHPVSDAACVAQLVRSGWEDSGVRNACYRTVAVNENRRCLIAPSVP